MTIVPGRDRVAHVSQISEERRVQNASDKLAAGDVVGVKVIEVDKQGCVRRSMKRLEGRCEAPHHRLNDEGLRPPCLYAVC